MTTATEVKQCARCNGKASKEWFLVSDLTVGLECKAFVEDKAKSTGKKGNALKSLIRDDYKAMMRLTTVTGMILSDFLKLEDMIAKGKINTEEFIACAEKRYRGDKAKAIVKALKKDN